MGTDKIANGFDGYKHLIPPLQKCILDSLPTSQHALIKLIAEGSIVPQMDDPEMVSLDERLFQVICDKNRVLGKFLSTIKGEPVLGENTELSDSVASYMNEVACLVQRYERNLIDDLRLEPPPEIGPEHLYALRNKVEQDLKQTNRLVLADPSKKLLFFTPEVFSIIIDALKNYPINDEPPELVISFSELEPSQVVEIANLIASHRLGSVTLTSCALRDGSAQALAQGLAMADYTFKQLDASSNRIRDPGALAFLEPLKTKTIHLVLKNNHISDKAKAILSKVAEGSSSYSSLDI